MSIPERFIEEIKDRVSVSEVLGKRIRLIPNGREFKANCPFHNEKTPSFTVNDEKGFYYCFGCQAKGNQISFLMDHDKLSFPEAVETLAGMAGMDIPRSSPEEVAREQQRESLGDIVTVAAEFYRTQLFSNSARQARSYVDRRGLTRASVDRFMLGYAPPSPRGTASPLVSHLTGLGFSHDQIVEAGLAKFRDEGGAPYDFFRDRLMFSITDGRNRPIGFGGRILGDGEPKYLNSPDGPLFDKGRVLYGLAQAREAARSKGRLIITEGYMDVIALSEAGFTEAVAPLGTAITEQHFLSGWRTSPEIVLCFDGDNAGQRAALRAAERCLTVIKTGKRLSFSVLPSGEDPDTFIRKFGVDAFGKIIEHAKPLAEQLWSSTAAQTGNAAPDALAADRKRLREMTAKIPDADLGQSYWKLFDDRLRTMGRPQARPGARKQNQFAATQTARGPLQSNASPASWMQRHQFELLLAALLHHPLLLERLDEQVGQMDIPFADLRDLRDALIDCLVTEVPLDSDSVQCNLDSIATVAESARSLMRKSRSFSEEGARKTHDVRQAGALVDHLIEVMRA